MMLKPKEKTYVQMQAASKAPGTSRTFTVYGIGPADLAPMFQKFVEQQQGRSTSEPSRRGRKPKAA